MNKPKKSKHFQEEECFESKPDVVDPLDSIRTGDRFTRNGRRYQVIRCDDFEFLIANLTHGSKFTLNRLHSGGFKTTQAVWWFSSAERIH